MSKVRIWDLPTRLFHWTLAALVVFSFVSAKLGGAWMDWHPRSGYAILTLVLFRVVWGFAGSRYALFATFVRGPVGAIRALRAAPPGFSGHAPLGAYSVLAMLGAVFAQGSLGLFTNDAISYEGPWARFVSSDLGETLSTLHRRGQWLIGALVGLHLAAIAWYASVKREPLVSAMVTGDRVIDAIDADDDTSLRLRAALLFAMSAGLVGYLVTL